MGELHHAAYKGDLEGVRACLQAGADPNGYDESGYCPLHWVAFRGLAGRSPVEVARLLLEAGADPNAVTKCEIANSALLLACQAGAGPMARLLVDSGADINASCGNHDALDCVLDERLLRERPAALEPGSRRDCERTIWDDCFGMGRV
jgi:ankyrin repeat protein